MPTVTLYGLRVHAPLPLPGVPAAAGPADIELAVAEPGRPVPFEPAAATCVYVGSGPADDAGRGLMEFHRRPPWSCLRCTGHADFFFAEPSGVTAFAHPGADPTAVETLFLGPVCALLLELRGTVCLHASAVRVGDSAVAVAGPSGAGKSSLAAALVARGGALLTDDILPLALADGTCRAVPGYPRLRLSPESARATAAPADDRPGKGRLPVGRGWGHFEPTPAPLRAVYVLDRSPEVDTPVSLSPLNPTESFLEVLRHGFAARLVEVLGLRGRRLALLAQVARQVRVCRLRLPNDLGRLDAACAAVAADAHPEGRP